MRERIVTGFSDKLATTKTGRQLVLLSTKESYSRVYGTHEFHEQKTFPKTDNVTSCMSCMEI